MRWCVVGQGGRLTRYDQRMIAAGGRGGPRGEGAREGRWDGRRCVQPRASLLLCWGALGALPVRGGTAVM
jgi:hypothetical protein